MATNRASNGAKVLYAQVLAVLETESQNPLSDQEEPDYEQTNPTEDDRIRQLCEIYACNIVQ
jgi:hypothetical protein